MKAIRAAMDANPWVAQSELAFEMQLSPRTIQRCLARHGFTLAKLRAVVLLAKYGELSLNPSLNESEKALALGFEAVSALSHFRQRWESDRTGAKDVVDNQKAGKSSKWRKLAIIGGK